jgi:hypothetical protein
MRSRLRNLAASIQPPGRVAADGTAPARAQGMLGLILIGLVAFLLVSVAVPLVLWTLAMETQNERAAAAAAPASSARLRLAHGHLTLHRLVAKARPGDEEDGGDAFTVLWLA